MIAIRDLVPDRDREADPVPDRGPGDPQLIPRFGNPGKRRVPDQNPGPVPDLVEDPSPGLDQDRKMGKKNFFGTIFGVKFGPNQL